MKTTPKFTFVAFVCLVSIITFVFAADHPVASVSADAALAKLKEGNARFVGSKVSSGKPTAARRAVTAALAGDTAPGHLQLVVDDIQPAVQAVKGKPGDATQLAVAENARLMAEKIRKEANLGDLAKDVRIISAVYDLDNGKVEWLK